MMQRWNNLRTGHKSLILLVAVGIAQIIWFYFKLPEEVVMHWDSAGNPEYNAHKGFMALILLVVLLVIAVFAWVLGYQSSLFREARLPNHKYWYSPDRFDRTVEIIGNCHLWVGNAFVAFWLVVNYSIFTDNLPSATRPGNLVGYALLAMLAFATFQYLKTWLYFRKKR